MSSTATAPSGILSRLALYPVPVLVAMCLFAWLPGLFSLPALDRDESRFAQASKQMIETGDYIDIRFSTVPRYNKPVGIYWAQAAVSRALGHSPYNQIWTYRLPSLAGALFAVLLTFGCGCALASRETALVGAALLGLSVLLSGEAQIATTDALLLATIVCAHGVLLRAYLFHRNAIATRPSLLTAMLGWAAVGAGILLKGPVILAVIALTAIALSLWDRNWKWLRALRPVAGIPVMLGIVLPWAIAIAVASHGAFYERSLGHDFAAKVMGGQETHGAPPGYYLVLAAVTLWPGTLFALPAIGASVMRRTEPEIRYLLAWIVPNWILFEAVPTKLPHYILPIYPALALLTALFIVHGRDAAQPRWLRMLETVSIILFIVVALAVASAVMVVPKRLGVNLSLLPMFGTAGVLILALAAVLLQLKKKGQLSAASAIAGALLLYPLLTAAVAPHLSQLWISQTLTARVASNRHAGDPPIVLSGYLEPSLVFLLGTNTRLESAPQAGAIAGHQGGLALIGDRERGPFLVAVKKVAANARAVDEVAGFDYSRGREVHVTVYRVTPAPFAKMHPAR